MINRRKAAGDECPWSRSRRHAIEPACRRRYSRGTSATTNAHRSGADVPKITSKQFETLVPEGRPCRRRPFHQRPCSERHYALGHVYKMRRQRRADQHEHPPARQGLPRWAGRSQRPGCQGVSPMFFDLIALLAATAPLDPTGAASAAPPSPIGNPTAFFLGLIVLVGDLCSTSSSPMRALAASAAMSPSAPSVYPVLLLRSRLWRIRPLPGHRVPLGRAACALRRQLYRPTVGPACAGTGPRDRLAGSAAGTQTERARACRRLGTRGGAEHEPPAERTLAGASRPRPGLARPAPAPAPGPRRARKTPSLDCSPT